MIMRDPEYVQQQSREIFLKRDFLESVHSGTKTSELRIAFPSFANISVGDRITFKAGGG